MSTEPPPTQTHTGSGIPLTDIDRGLIAMQDEDFKLITWDDLRHIILVTNKLEDLKRRPSDLRRYIKWSTETKAQYGSITNFVVQNRLHWTPLDSASAVPTFAHHNDTPFADTRDYQILINDWPYGLVPGITHLVAWTKTPIPVDPNSELGDVSVEMRALIDEFVARVFTRRVDEACGQGEGEARVLWFKNWVGLQSVRGVDHVHVLVRDAPAELLKEWTKQTSD